VLNVLQVIGIILLISDDTLLLLSRELRLGLKKDEKRRRKNCACINDLITIIKTPVKQ
jgi:hypothetical protein